MSETIDPTSWYCVNRWQLSVISPKTPLHTSPMFVVAEKNSKRKANYQNSIQDELDNYTFHIIFAQILC